MTGRTNDWTRKELRRIAETDDLHVAPFREDGVTYGTPTWIWSVVAGDAGAHHAEGRVIAAPRSTLIRPAAPGDVPTLGRLGVALVRMHHDLDPRRFLASTTGDEGGYAAYLGAQLEEPRAVVLVAEREGEVVGYAYGAVEDVDCMALRGEAGMLHDLYVLPEHRGRGLGRALLTEAIAALDALGAPRLVLSAAERNEAAQRLFASIGFRRTMVEMTREREAR